MPRVGDFDDLSRDMKRAAAAVRQDSTRQVRLTALSVISSVVLSNRVDTGRSRSAWEVSLDAPSVSEFVQFVPGKRGSTESINTQATLSAASSRIDSFSSKNTSINISNNVDYIDHLNTFIDPGFIEQAVEDGIQNAQDVQFNLFE